MIASESAQATALRIRLDRHYLPLLPAQQRVMERVLLEEWEDESAAELHGDRLVEPLHPRGRLTRHARRRKYIEEPVYG